MPRTTQVAAGTARRAPLSYTGGSLGASLAARRQFPDQSFRRLAVVGGASDGTARPRANDQRPTASRYQYDAAAAAKLMRVSVLS